MEPTSKSATWIAPHVDPIADDLASLPLDLLVVETGTMPPGVNFMVIHGDPSPE